MTTNHDRPSFPRQSARTMRFTLGVPRAFTFSSDGRRLAFLRSPSGTDRRTCLWVLDVEAGDEQLVANPTALLGRADEDCPPPSGRDANVPGKAPAASWDTQPTTT